MRIVSNPLNGVECLAKSYIERAGGFDNLTRSAQVVVLVLLLLHGLTNAYQIFEEVLRSVLKGASPSQGRMGFSAEQVLVAMVMKNLEQLSWRGLADRVLQSDHLLVFFGCKSGDRHLYSRFQRNCMKIDGEVFQSILNSIVSFAVGKKLDTPELLAADTFAARANIHHPTDSSLLEDSHRIIHCLTEKLDKLYEIERIPDHSRLLASRLNDINRAKSGSSLEKPYQDMMDAVFDTVEVAERVAESIPESDVEASAIAGKITEVCELSRSVIGQTFRRVFKDEKVPAEEKVVSVSDPHAQVIEKGGRETIFGHKVLIVTTPLGLISQIEVLDGCPRDVDLLPMIRKRHRQLFPNISIKCVVDSGFHKEEKKRSKVTFLSPETLKHSDLSTKERKTYLNFRAGIEGLIAHNMSHHGLKTIMAKGLKRFVSTIVAIAVAHSLDKLARAMKGVLLPDGA